MRIEGLDEGSKRRVIDEKSTPLKIPRSEVKRTPQAVLKVVSYGSGYAAKRLMDYVARDHKGKDRLDLEDQDGNKLSDNEAIKDLYNDWANDFEERNNKTRQTRHVTHIVLSADVDNTNGNAQRVEASARAFLQDHFGIKGYQYAFVIHRDTEFPHVHVIIKNYNRELSKKLRLQPADLNHLREEFAKQLSNHGLDHAAERKRKTPDELYKTMQSRLEGLKKASTYYEQNVLLNIDTKELESVTQAAVKDGINFANIKSESVDITNIRPGVINYTNETLWSLFEQIQAERTAAIKSEDTEKLRLNQKRFTAVNALLRNGVSMDAVKSWANDAVKKGKLSQADAALYIKNTEHNYIALVNAGVLSRDGSFVDEKAAQILYENIDNLDFLKLRVLNIEAYKEHNSAIEKGEQQENRRPDMIEIMTQTEEMAENIDMVNFDAISAEQRIDTQIEFLEKAIKQGGLHRNDRDELKKEVKDLKDNIKHLRSTHKRSSYKEATIKHYKEQIDSAEQILKKSNDLRETNRSTHYDNTEKQIDIILDQSKKVTQEIDKILKAANSLAENKNNSTISDGRKDLEVLRSDFISLQTKINEQLTIKIKQLNLAYGMQKEQYQNKVKLNEILQTLEQRTQRFLRQFEKQIDATPKAKHELSSFMITSFKSLNGYVTAEEIKNIKEAIGKPPEKDLESFGLNKTLRRIESSLQKFKQGYETLPDWKKKGRIDYTINHLKKVVEDFESSNQKIPQNETTKAQLAALKEIKVQIGFKAEKEQTDEAVIELYKKVQSKDFDSLLESLSNEEEIKAGISIGALNKAFEIKREEVEERIAENIALDFDAYKDKDFFKENIELYTQTERESGRLQDDYFEHYLEASKAAIEEKVVLMDLDEKASLELFTKTTVTLDKIIERYKEQAEQKELKEDIQYLVSSDYAYKAQKIIEAQINEPVKEALVKIYEKAIDERIKNELNDGLPNKHQERLERQEGIAKLTNVKEQLNNAESIKKGQQIGYKEKVDNYINNFKLNANNQLSQDAVKQRNVSFESRHSFLKNTIEKEIDRSEKQMKNQFTALENYRAGKQFKEQKEQLKGRSKGKEI